MAVQYHPLNYDSLNIGDIITEEQITTITGHQPDTTKFSLGALNLKESIARELAARGKIVTMTVAKGVGIKILTHAEAAAYNENQSESLTRRLIHAHFRNSAVDPRELDDDQRKRHDRTLLINGARIIAMSDAERRVELQVAERKTPGRIEHSGDK